jgi:hypothetical protein
MFIMKSLFFAGLLSVVAVKAQQSAYGQCGGIGWSGATTCVSGYVCTYSSEYYSQCIPGTAATTTLTTITSAPTTGTGTATSTGAASTTISGGGSGPGTTLQSGYYWIRAVESPNFHKYLQTSPEYVSGIAIMDDYTTAGQFQIVSGQLVELISTGLLYLNVSPQTNSSETKLPVSFETTQNTYGTFAFSGDAVQWSISSIDRPNLSAWLVCTDQQLFINLGAYDYDTPSGCADETIHYYNGATAVD